MTDPPERPTTSQSAVSSDPDAKTARLWRGFGWGVVATVAMSIPMIVGMAAGVAPMPEPIAKAFVTLAFGGGFPLLF